MNRVHRLLVAIAAGLAVLLVLACSGDRDAALADLQWCLAHADRAPHAGWLREVQAHLVAVRRGETAAAKPVLFTTPFSGDAQSGHQFSPRAIREAVPGSVYVLSGFEFTEYHFIVSADRKELIAIDAGTRPDAAREAHEALRARVPGLPPLTTVFVT